ncbi:prepilin peptidase [Candidatus Gottesmanbacteria bacterium]|nr:prepilin peptidase [Candidatus Gottesmanbacteria bacterium]
MIFLNLIVIFILGLCVGSFLNVLIDRIPTGKSIWRGRSHCDHCKHVLSWYELIPVVSFFMLERKCRRCHKKISWQYPLIEIITGILFLFTYTLFIQITEVYILLKLIYYLMVISGLIAIFFTDLKYRIIPDEILIVLTAITVFYLFFSQKIQFLNHILSGLVFFSIFLILVIITRGKGMGLGDVKYAFVMGFILGSTSTIVSFYLSFLTGAAVSLILVIRGRKSMKSTIPFGPFLTGATVVSLYYGDYLWNIFRKIIGL